MLAVVQEVVVFLEGHYFIPEDFLKDIDEVGDKGIIIVIIA